MAGCTIEEMRGWRDELKKDFPEINWIDPCDRSYGPQQWRQLVEDDISDIKKSDFMLVNFWKSGVGTSMEMVVARQQLIPVITVTPDFKMTSPWVRYFSDYLVEDFDHAIKIIKMQWGSAGVEDVHHP
jgi:nucleoside 2-deoxyribosyltransferase